MADTKLETSDANVESHWQTFSRRLMEAAALSRSLVATPRLPTMLQSPLSRLRTPLTRLLGKQRRLCTGPEDTGPAVDSWRGGTNNHVCLPGAAWDHVLRRGQLTPHTLARVALADAWSAARVAEVCSLEDSWESWAALSPRPTKMDVEHLLTAFTLKLRPDRAIDRLQVIEKALNEYDTKASCFEGRNMPGSWVDEGLSGSMAQILGKVVKASLWRAAYTADDVAQVFLTFHSPGCSRPPDDEDDALTMATELAWFCDAASLGSATTVPEREVFAAVAARCGMHEEVRASFLNLARDDETSDDADAKEAAGDTEMEDAEVAGGEGQSTEAGAETGAHSPVGASPKPAVSDAVEVTGERSWEETGPPPAAPAPAADRFASFFEYDEDDDTAAEEGRKRSLDETDYAAPPPQM